MSPLFKISALIAVLLVSVVLSLMTGAQWVPVSQVPAALFAPDAMNLNHILVNSTRLPRTLLAVVVGAALAVSGTLMQALTRNPLASPGLFGVNAGAVFGIILFSSLFSLTSLQAWLWSALPGAVLAGTLVWLVGNMGQGKMNPLRIVLAGASITAMFTAFSQAWLVMDQEGLNTVLFWLAGSLNERSLQVTAPLILSCLPAFLVAMLLAGQINVLNAGEEIATGLGQNIALIRLVMSVLIIWLAGCAVALAGSIGFIGLVVPHMARRLISIDHRWLLPGGALLGGILLMLADVLARVLILPREVPVGVMTALFGAPFFIMLVRRGRQYA